MFNVLLPIPSASTTIALASQDVQTWFNQLSPLLVLLGIPVAIAILAVLVYIIKAGFSSLVGIFTGGYGEPEDYMEYDAKASKKAGYNIFK